MSKLNYIRLVQTLFFGFLFIASGCGQQKDSADKTEPITPDKSKTLITLDMQIAENFQRKWCSGNLPVETEITTKRLRSEYANLDCYESARQHALARGIHLSSVDRGDKITDLRPIAVFENITWLDVSRNEWTNINPLVSLSELKNLKTLDLSWNHLKNINGISEFTPNVESLDLSYNPIEVVTSSLFSLPRGLKRLSISLNKASYEAIRRLKDLNPHLEKLELGTTWPLRTDAGSKIETEAFLQTLKVEFPKTQITVNGRHFE